MDGVREGERALGDPERLNARRGRVVVFARAPRPGAVKTRLAPRLGAQGAAELAQAMLRDTWDALRAAPGLDAVVATTGPLGPELTDLMTWDQGEGDLGARIERMLRRALEDAPYALAVGADSPGLPASRIEEARLALRRADAVLGPAEDGGFYLLGVRRCPPGLLAELPWSRPDTAEAVRRRLKQRGFDVAVIEPWFDVDRPADLCRLERELRAGSLRAPATAAALGRLGACARITVVVPTLNEAARIDTRLRELEAMPDVAEVIVVDGGSADDTVARALAHGLPTVLTAPRGRAAQMNRGAAAATGDVLLFLHADVSLPPDATAAVRQALVDPRVVGGAFRTWTVPDGGTWRLGPLLHLADLRSRYSGVPYGDQALFVRTDAFRALGGFPELPLMEDLALSRALRRLGRLVTLPASVRVSGRRFEDRPLYYTTLVNLYPLLYRLGVPAAWLARRYGDPR